MDAVTPSQYAARLVGLAALGLLCAALFRIPAASAQSSDADRKSRTTTTSSSYTMTYGNSWWGFGSGTKGSGKIVESRRTEKGYRAVAVNGPFEVHLRQTGQESHTITADDNLLELISSTIEQGKAGPTLVLGVKKGASFSTQRPIIVKVEVDQIERLVVSGSGDVVIEDGLKAEKLVVALSGSGNARLTALSGGTMSFSVSGAGDVRVRKISAESVSAAVAGSGDVSLDGTSGSLRVTIAGSGDIRADGLDCRDVTVSIAGSGDAAVRAGKTLKVSIAGSGDVTYRGDPTLTKSIAGSGSVTQRK